MTGAELLQEIKKLVPLLWEAEALMLGALELQQGTSSRLGLYASLGQSCSDQVARLALDFAKRRSSGEPLQHILGKQTFLEHEYAVGPDVLIPRPETEGLVKAAIARLQLRPHDLGIEIGVGSGVLSTELLKHFPSLRMLASDASTAALARARTNAQRVLGDSDAHRLTLLHAASPTDVFGPFKEAGVADFLISNPPYLSPDDEIQDEVVKHEPKLALFPSNDDPLFFYSEIAAHAPTRVRPRGLVLLEVAHERAHRVAALFEPISENVEVLRDLAGRERFVIAVLKDYKGA